MCLTSGDFTNYGTVSLPPGLQTSELAQVLAAAPKGSVVTNVLSEGPGVWSGGMGVPEPADWPTS